MSVIISIFLTKNSLLSAGRCGIIPNTVPELACSMTLFFRPLGISLFCWQVITGMFFAAGNCLMKYKER